MTQPRRSKALHSQALCATSLTPVERLRHQATGLLPVALLALLGAPALAQSVPQPVALDTSQPQAGAPRLDVAANGTPIVKIATPNERGVSRNRYTDFNVDDRNLILNNSDRITQSLLGGFIDGNGNLKRSGPASLILNEVTGSNASLLRGYVEIAGASAQFVLANANGIACEGCGFVNTPWITLVTGTPRIDATGRVGGYSISNGTLSVGGSGLDARNARLDLFARAIQLNAGVYADRVEGSFGAGELAVNPDGGVTVTGATTSGLAARPAFGLDVAALGGMYARSIRLVGTEAGLGVRVDGTLASLDGGLTLDSRGGVRVGGTVTSGAGATINGTDVDVAGTVYAEGPLAVTAGSLDTSGLVASGGDLTVAAQAIGGDGTYAAGMARDGTASRPGIAILSATGVLSVAGQVLARDAVALDAGALTVGGRVQAAGVSVRADAVNVAGGELRAGDGLSVTAGSLKNSGLLQGRSVALTAGAMANRDGVVDARDRLTVSVGALDNTDGVIQSAGATTIGATSLVNSGGLIAATGTDALSLSVTGALEAAGGTIGGNGDVALSIGSAALSEGASVVARGALTLDSPGTVRLTSGAKVQAGGTASVKADALTVDDGTVQSGGALTVWADRVTSGANGLIAGSTLAVTAGELANGGRLLADGGATVAASRSLTNSGLIQSNGRALTLSATTLANSGTIALAGDGALSVSGSNVTNGGTVLSNGSVGVSAASLTNSGAIQSGGANTLAAVTFRQDGRVSAGGALGVTADRLASMQGTFEAGGELKLAARDLFFSGTTVAATGTGGLTITADNELVATDGRIGGNGAVALNGGTVDLTGSQVTAEGALAAEATVSDLRLGTGGLVAAGGPVTLTAAGTLDGAGARIESEGLATLTARRVLLDGGLLQADRFALNAPELSLRRARLRQTGGGDFVLRTDGVVDYSGGELFVGGQNLIIDAGAIVSADGAILHGGTGALSLAAARAIENAGGRIATNGALTLRAASLDNGEGEITANGAANVGVTGALTNAGGLLASGAGLTLTAGALDNRAGAIETTGQAKLSVASLDGSGGSILATGVGGALSMAATGAVAGTGLIGSSGDVGVTAASVRMGADDRVTSDRAVALATSGLLAIGGTVDGTGVALFAGALEVGATGQVVTPGALGVTAATVDVGGLLQGGSVTVAGDALTLTDGLLQSLGAARIDVRDRLTNSGGEIAAADGLTLTAGELRNAGRIVQSGEGPFALTIARLLDNSDGALLTNGTLSVRADALVNSGGQIGAAGALDLVVAGTLDNGGGAVRGDADVTLTASAVRNDGGAVDALGGLDVDSDRLDNGGGSLVARGGGGLAIQTDALTNGTGVLGSTGALTIATGGLANAGSIAGEDTSLSFDTLANTGLITGSTTSLTGRALTNVGGEIGSTGALSLTVDDTDNTAGRLIAGATGLTLAADRLRNADGTLGGAGEVAVDAADVENGTGTIAAGTDLTIATTRLSNAAGGALWADGTTLINATESVRNRGSIGAGERLSLTVPTLDNGRGETAGIIGSPGVIELNYQSGSVGGTVSRDDVTVTRDGDYATVAGETVLAQGTLTLNLGGSLSNAGRLEGVNGLTATVGRNITNLASGEIVGPSVTLQAGGDVLNQGLINAGELSVSGRTVTNEGVVFADTALIAGLDAITNRGAQAVIATRSGLLALESAGAITNRDGAFLYSLGDLSIGGADGAAAASFLNSSAVVQADGDVTIAAREILNRRTTVESGLVEREPVEIFERFKKPGKQSFIDGFVNERTTIVSVMETALTADSGAGRIVAGGSIGLSGDAIENRFSTVAAGGDLRVNGIASPEQLATGGVQGFTNIALVGPRTTRTEVFEDTDVCGSPDKCDTIYLKVSDTTKRDSVTAAPGLVSANGSVVIDALNIRNLTTTGGGGGGGEPDPVTTTTDVDAVRVADARRTTLGVAEPGVSAGGGGLLAQVSDVVVDNLKATGVLPVTTERTSVGVAAAGTPEAKAAEFGFALASVTGQATGAPGGRVLDLGGLFRFALPGSSVLVESDPRFTSFGRFLSSDYFLTRLGFDPARVQQRLGDALYEQQLVTNQMVAQAGVGRLPGFGSGEAQYRALLDAGVEVVQRFSLGLGVALSAEQMATLTTDVVILVETEVQTAEGPHTVLAPRLYLTKVSSRDLTSGGAVIAGRDVTLRAAGSFENAGVVRASAGTVVRAGDVLNTGRLELGAVGRVSAVGDLTNRAGTITGGDVTLVAGRDLTLDTRVDTTRTATAWRSGKKNYRSDTLSETINIGGLVATTGDLALGAGRDLTISGSQVSVGGDLDAYAGRDLSIRSVEDSFASTSTGRSGKTRFDEAQSGVTNILSTVDVATIARFGTPGAFSVSGATIESGGALSVNAGTVSVTGVTDVATIARDTVRKSRGLLSSKTTTTKFDLSDETIVSSTLSGNTVDLRSDGNTSILGSNVVASEGVTIASGGDITIGALAATDTQSEMVRTKKSGLSLGGGGLFLGVAKSKTDTDTRSVTNTGSLIGSERGDVVVDANGLLAINGSTVATTGDVALLGDGISIGNTTDIYESSTRTKSSSVGLSVGIQSPVLSGIDTVRRIGGIVADGEASDRTRAVAGLASGAAAYNAGDAVGRAVSAANLANGGNGAKTGDVLNNLAEVTVSFGVSKSRSESATRDETVNGSAISGDNVALIARGGSERAGSGTIDVTGSTVTAAGDLLASAPGDITVRSAQETDTLSSSNKSSGFTVGAAFGLKGGFTPSASVNLSKGNASGTDVTNVESLLSAGGTATVTNPDGTLTLKGAQLSGNRVVVNTGALDILSEQDTSRYRSKQDSVGLSVSTVGASGNLGRERMSGDFASVQEQSGIVADEGGFDVTVAGATSLTGGTIASTAEAARNRLTTGSLSATDIENRERFSASSLNIGGGIGSVGKTTDGRATNGTERVPGVPVPGIGAVSATLPSAMSASGRQGSTTVSSVAPGTIAITGDDPASRAVATGLSRDAAAAGALTRRFDEAQRRDIEQGFAATRALTNEVGTFFANRAAEEAELTEAADEALAAGDIARAAELKLDAKALNDSYGSGSLARVLATAITGAAGGNVAGGLGELARGAAANVLQGLAVEQVKRISDSLLSPDGRGTPSSEVVRAALQAVVGCGGTAAGGSNSCGSAATGAAASVVVNYLLTNFVDPEPRNVLTGADDPRSLADQEARKDLVATIVAGISVATGGDVAAAVTAARIETEKNDLFLTKSGNQRIQVCPAGQTCADTPTLEQLRDSTDATDRTHYENLIKEYGSFDGAAAAINREAELQRVGVQLGQASANDINFVGGRSELSVYLAGGGSLESLQREKRAYVDATVTTFVDNLGLDDAVARQIKQKYAAGDLDANDTIELAFKTSVGPVNYAVGQASKDRLKELNDLRFAINLLPTSRIATIITTTIDAGGDIYGEAQAERLLNAASLAEDAAVQAVLDTRSRAGADTPKGLRVETINGRRVFTGKPALGPPSAGEGFVPDNRNQRIGLEGEIKLGRAVSEIPNQYVIDYAGKPGTHGADVISVDADGKVYLWDNKVRNSASGAPNTTIQDTPTFKQDSNRLSNALNQATDLIASSDLPADVRRTALSNLQKGNFETRTVGDGNSARNSTIRSFRGFQQTDKTKIITKPQKLRGGR